MKSAKRSCARHTPSSCDADQIHLSVGAVAVGAGAAATGVAAVAGAAAGSAFSSAPKSGSSKGPLVADMPGAGFVVGTAGISAEGAGAAGSAVGAVASVGLASVAAGASVEGVWAETAVGGAGATAPAGSGAESGSRQCMDIFDETRKGGRKAKTSRHGILARCESTKRSDTPKGIRRANRATAV